MSEYGFIEHNGTFVDELDVKKAFELAEDKLQVLLQVSDEVSKYIWKFTLESVLKTKRFSHLSDFEKEAIVDYIVEFY